MDQAPQLPPPFKKKRPGWLAPVLISAAFLGAAFVAYQAVVSFKRMSYNSRTPGNNKAHLSSLQSAINIYYGDKSGEYPKSLEGPEFLGKYIDAIPVLDLSKYGFEKSNKVEVYAFPEDWIQNPSKLRNTGHWAYNPETGRIIIDSSQKDDFGKCLCQYGYE